MNQSIFSNFSTKIPAFQHARWLLFIAFFLFLPASTASADIGPKPSMEFIFQYEITTIPIISGQLIECDNETCSQGSPLQQLGPQGFQCTESSCSSLAYGYSDFHKLVIQFEDKARESNVFTKKAFSAEYSVTVQEDELLVEENKKLFGGNCFCCSGFLSTLALETLVASLYLGAFHLPRAVIGFVPLASLVTLPFVWLAFPLLPVPFGWMVALSETFAVLGEALLLYFAALKTISLKHFLVLSVTMNAVSFGFGLFLR